MHLHFGLFKETFPIQATICMAYNYLLSLQSYLDEVKTNLNRLRYTHVHQNALRRRSTVNNLFSVTRQDREREKNTTHHRFSNTIKVL